MAIKSIGSRFSAELLHKQKNVIAQGALTNSKRPESFVKHVFPTHVKKWEGCYLYDHAGNRYIDFLCGLGTNLLGYNSPYLEPIYRKYTHAACPSLPTEEEFLFGEAIRSTFPFVEKIKVLKTGSEACSAALRIARAHHGPYHVGSEGFHGWHDDFVSLSKPAIGVPPRDWMNGLSIQIIEPVITDASDSQMAQLKLDLEIAEQKERFMIYDEVITGLRYKGLAVSSCLTLKPDLIVLGKALGNGEAIAVVGGKADIMDGDPDAQYFVSSTYAGEVRALAVATEVLRLLKTKVFDVDTLWARGEYFFSRFKELLGDFITIEGYPTRGTFKGEMERRALFIQECVKAGLLFHPSTIFLSFAHCEGQILDHSLNIISDVMTKIKLGRCKLEGELPKSPFAQQVRDNK